MREKNERGREGERDVVWPLDPARPEWSTFYVCQYILSYARLRYVSFTCNLKES